MSKENIYLVTIGVLLCVLNAILGGPLGVRIASVFARLFAPKAVETAGTRPSREGAASRSDELSRGTGARVEQRDRAA